MPMTSGSDLDPGRHVLGIARRNVVLGGSKKIALPQNSLHAFADELVHGDDSPPEIAPAASTKSGTNMTDGDSWTWCMVSMVGARCLPWKVRKIRRQE